jgi:lysyl endopeptidase
VRAVTVHHPNGEEKRISFEDDPTTITSYLGTDSPGDNTHIRIADWDLGTTEPGSSGSPLFDQGGRIVGQLHGGNATCGNDQSDWYGRIFRSWTGGGTDSTRLSNWLDPLGSGVVALDGKASDFHFMVSPAFQAVCGPAAPSYAISLVREASFTSPVTFVVSGTPPGSTVSLSVNPIPQGTTSSTLTLTTGEVFPGDYLLTIANDLNSVSQQVGLHVDSKVPARPAAEMPANGIGNQPVRPTFHWSASVQASTYTLEIATDPDFATVVYRTAVSGESHTPGSNLPADTLLFWRVRAANSCGESQPSVTSSFRSAQAPCLCELGTDAVQIYQTGFEAGPDGWSVSGTGSTWALSTTDASSGAASFHANAPGVVSDQFLVSPPIPLPSDVVSVTLQFQNRRNIEARTATSCFDVGVLEISADGGSSWSQLGSDDLVADPYTGLVSSPANPLHGREGWCGDTQGWRSSRAELTDYRGQTVQIRFRLSTDELVAREGWFVDEVSVTSCVAGTPPAAPLFTSAPPATGAMMVPYLHRFVASGFPASTFVVTEGTLPPGLALDPATGVLSGTPGALGNYGPITVSAANGVGAPASQTFALTIHEGFAYWMPIVVMDDRR